MEQQYIQETTCWKFKSKLVFFSLEKDGDVVIGGMVVPKLRPYIPFTVVGENRKSLRVQRKDLNFVSIDVKPSAGFKRKTNPTEGGKWKSLLSQNMDSDGDAVANSSTFWCYRKTSLNVSAKGITYNNYVWTMNLTGDVVMK